MADDDELMIVGESKRRKQQRKRRRNRKAAAYFTGSTDDCFSNSTSRDADILIIDEAGSLSTDQTDLIVLDSVESGEDECNGHLGTKERFKPKNNIAEQEASVQALLLKIQRLEEENNFLRCGHVRKDGTISIRSPIDGPHIEVIFYNSLLAQKYRKDVDKFLSEISSKERVTSGEKQKSSDEARDAPGCSFVVDKESSKEQKSSSSSSGGWAVPVYNQDFGGTLQVVQPSDSKSSEEISNDQCFNCMGSHLIKDCPEKRNPQRIAQNKKKVYGNTGGGNKNRLGNEKLWQLKYKPGIISDALRSALNLRPIQIPGYIYTMRALGYPPGWLKEAEIDESSDIKIFDSEGKATKDDNDEEGEIDCAEIKAQYDATKIIDYPGFNIPVPQGCIDEHYKLGLPPLQLHQQRAEAEKDMRRSVSTPYRKRKLQLPSDKNSKTKSPYREVEDMEVEDTSDVRVQSSDEGIDDDCKFVSPMPLQTVQIDDDSADQSQDTVTSSQASSRISSPTLTDLEERKNRLIHDLEGASGEESDVPTKKVGDSESLDEVEVLSTPTRSKNDSTDLCSSKSVEPGTPVLTIHSDFKKLPTASSFAKGISDHINFENLPNSTGCYDKLKNVLGRVRDRTHNL